MRGNRFRPSGAAAGTVVLMVAIVALVGAGTVVGVGPAAANAASDQGTDALSSGEENATLEDAYEEPAPEPGDEYYEASDPDGDWISYANPRDRYRSPYNGDGSGKICVTLLNEAGEPIVGESVPNTTVTVPTGESLSWHADADPMAVQYPLTDHYERPLDSDQFGTDPDLPQGDGYMDSHCIEFHGFAEDSTVEYGEVEIDGEYADYIEVVGYIQRSHRAWETDIDPIEAAASYDEAGGGWTYEPGGSHGQAVIVLRLDPPAEAYPESVGHETDDRDDATEEPTDSTPTDDPAGGAETTETEGSTAHTDSDTATPASEPASGESIVDGFVSSAGGYGAVGVAASLVAIATIAVVLRGRRNDPP